MQQHAVTMKLLNKKLWFIALLGSFASAYGQEKTGKRTQTLWASCKYDDQYAVCVSVSDVYRLIGIYLCACLTQHNWVKRSSHSSMDGRTEASSAG